MPRPRLNILLLVCLVSCGSPDPAPLLDEARIAAAITDSLRRKVSDAKVTYQTQFYALMASEAPRLNELLEINRDLQIAYTRQSDMRYEYLWHNDPDRLVTDDGISAWLNFAWPDEDEARLLAQSREYAVLTERLTELAARNQDHEMWPEVRDVFQRIQEEPRMRRITEQLYNALDEVEAALAGEEMNPW